MSRGRRGGRRQRRREEQARQTQREGSAPKSNGQSGPAAVVVPAPAKPATAPTPSAAPAPGAAPAPAAAPAPVVVQPPAGAPAPATAAPVPAPSGPPPEPAQPRPMSARELVARMEKLRAQEAHAAHESAVAAGPIEPGDTPAVAVAGVAPAPTVEPRRFPAQGSDWIATHAGRGAGGTGRIAHARLEAIRFARAAEPEQIVAEVLAPHARLDDLYDDELAALLAQALRYRKEDG